MFGCKVSRSKVYIYQPNKLLFVFKFALSHFIPVLQEEGGGYFLENILEDGLIVWDQEFSNRLRYFCISVKWMTTESGGQNRYESDGNVPLD